MTKSTLMAGASRTFAHLAGLTPRAAARADDSKDKEMRGASEDDDTKCEDEDDNTTMTAPADDTEASDEGETEEEKKEKAKKAKAKAKAKAAEEDEDDGPGAEEDDEKKEMSGKSPAASARRRERARCAAIFAHPKAAANVALAASLAFETTMTAKEATAVLSSQSVQALAAGRADRNPRLGPGGQQAPTGPAAVSASWNAAFTKAGAKPASQSLHRG